MSQSDLRIRLVLTYTDASGPALDVDLHLPGAGITAIFGASGSGKTSLLRAVAGLERGARGEVWVAGRAWQTERLWLAPHRRPLGYVFQEANLFPHLSAADNLRFAERRAPPNADGRSREHIIELLGIGPLLTRRPDALSGGERQRVAIARALLIRPELLLMDEPLAALDEPRKREILPYLERLRAELALPVLYVSHSLAEVARLADHLVLLEAGRAVATGPLAELTARADLPIPLGEEAGAVLDAQVTARDHDWHLAQVNFAGGQLWVRDAGQPIGTKVRLRILARDVALARQRAEASSVQNQLPVRLLSLNATADPAMSLVELSAGETSGGTSDETSGTTKILARVTRRAVAELALAPGQILWAQIKAVAVVY